MLSKDAERKLLAKINALLAEAGPDSYIGMAFRGCAEAAAENIECDFGNSPADSAEHWEGEAHRLEAELAHEKSEADRLRECLNKTSEQYQAALDALKLARTYPATAAVQFKNALNNLDADTDDAEVARLWKSMRLAENAGKAIWEVLGVA